MVISHVARLMQCDICTHQTSTITITNSSSYESQGLDIYGNA